MVVDSCIDWRTQRPAALDYLKALNVSIAERVKLLVITHWHNDHMRGASAILQEAKSAQLFCSAALDVPEFYQIVQAQVSDAAVSSYVPEFATMLNILRDRNPGARPGTFGPEWVMEDRRIYYRQKAGGCPPIQVFALSPSSATMNIARLELAPFLPEYKRPARPARRPVGISPNRLAVALWVEFGDTPILLGSDLEESGNATMGWQAVVNSPRRPAGRACTFKVAHHGSNDAHNDDVWGQMLVEDPVALIAPYAAGKTPRPSTGDVARIKSKTMRAYCTAPPTGFKPPRRDSAVERLVGYRLRAVAGPMGHIRLRWRASGAPPLRPELFGPAHLLK